MIRSHMEANGLSPDNVILDSKIHRFKLNSKDDRKSGWYIGFQNISAKTNKAFDVVVYGSWESGETFKYIAENDLTDQELENLKVTINTAVLRAEKEKTQSQLDVANKQKIIWDKIVSETISTYLENKKIIGLFGTKIQNNVVYVPMRDESGKLWGLQKIYRDGKKLFAKGQRVQSCFHVIGEITDDVIFICEGFATGASIHQATGKTVIVAFNAGNLIHVAEIFKEKRIIICGDDDRNIKNNPGRTKALEAAKRTLTYAIFPTFKDKIDGTDFNDLHLTEGLETIANQINEAIAKQNSKNNLIEIVELNKPDIETVEFKEFIEGKNKAIELPPLSGLLLELSKDIAKCSNVSHPTFTYGGAIMTMATLCLGRYTVNAQWPNLFSLLLGGVSAGKSSVMSYTRQFFNSVYFKDHNLNGKNNYASNIAMIQSLPEQRFRLDTVDEGSSAIRGCMDKNARDWGKFQLYTELWSACGKYFGGIPAITRAESYACDSPAINLMFGCQIDTLVKACTSDLFEVGFIPRCLIFSTEEEGILTKDFTPNELNQSLLLNLLHRFPNDRFKNGVVIKPKELVKKPELKDKIFELRNSCYEKLKSISAYDKIEKDMYTKVCENSFRLASVLMASDDTEELTVKHLDDARLIVETLLYNGLNILNRAGGSAYSKDLIAIENCIKSQTGVIKLRDISSRFRHIPIDRKHAYYRDLEDQGKIKIEKTRSGLKVVSYIG